MKKRLLISVIVQLFLLSNCDAQPELRNRAPYASGKFYPSDAGELRLLLTECFEKAKAKQTGGDVLAIISPHAGYIYSGVVAASAFNQIDYEKNYKNIFILGISHGVPLKGASIYSKGNYLTPLGEVKVNIELAGALIEKYDVFSFKNEAHINEHSVEVQLPFLQYKMKSDFMIVPIVAGASDLNTCQQISDALQPYFNEDNLFIISSDFSHYPSYSDANIVDGETAEAIKSNSVEELLRIVTGNERKGIKNLATSMCGWPAVFSLLFMAQHYPALQVDHVQYLNSGDVPFGDKTRVVGYHAFVYSLNKTEANHSKTFELDINEKLELLKIARDTIERYIAGKSLPNIDAEKLTPPLLSKCGAFVTLHKHRQLRGCIGRFISDEPLYKVVQQMAVASATEDYRFPRVSENEIDLLEIEISVLSPLKKIESIDEFELGKHGIYIIKGNRTGTFLPQVAAETNWTKEEFIGHCARDKAGIGWEGWRDADLYIYEADVFSEKDVGLK